MGRRCQQKLGSAGEVLLKIQKHTNTHMLLKYESENETYANTQVLLKYIKEEKTENTLICTQRSWAITWCTKSIFFMVV